MKQYELFDRQGRYQFTLGTDEDPFEARNQHRGSYLMCVENGQRNRVDDAPDLGDDEEDFFGIDEEEYDFEEDYA